MRNNPIWALERVETGDIINDPLQNSLEHKCLQAFAISLESILQHVYNKTPSC